MTKDVLITIRGFPEKISRCTKRCVTLDKKEPIDKLLYDGYSTLSLGYAGLHECVFRMCQAVR